MSIFLMIILLLLPLNIATGNKHSQNIQHTPLLLASDKELSDSVAQGVNIKSLYICISPQGAQSTWSNIDVGSIQSEEDCKTWQQRQLQLFDKFIERSPLSDNIYLASSFAAAKAVYIDENYAGFLALALLNHKHDKGIAHKIEQLEKELGIKYQICQSKLFVNEQFDEHAYEQLLKDSKNIISMALDKDQKQKK